MKYQWAKIIIIIIIPHHPRTRDHKSPQRGVVFDYLQILKTEQFFGYYMLCRPQKRYISGRKHNNPEDLLCRYGALFLFTHAQNRQNRLRSVPVLEPNYAVFCKDGVNNQTRCQWVSDCQRGQLTTQWLRCQLPRLLHEAPSKRCNERPYSIDRDRKCTFLRI